MCYALRGAHADRVLTGAWNLMLWPIWGLIRHHVLAGQDQAWVAFSGLAMDFDFVEAPSQMLEKWPVRLVP